MTKTSKRMGLPKCLQLSQRTSFISMIVLTTSFFIVEIVVGYATNSMALVADSFHMLSDVVSLLVGFIALRYSKVCLMMYPFLTAMGLPESQILAGSLPR